MSIKITVKNYNCLGQRELRKYYLSEKKAIILSMTSYVLRIIMKQIGID
jgi:hypothetical protein